MFGSSSNTNNDLNVANEDNTRHEDEAAEGEQQEEARTIPQTSDVDTSAEEHDAIEIRQEALQNTMRQADRMVRRTRGKIQKAKVGECVAIFVPEFDRGRGDPARVVGMILEIKDDRYKIGTRAGKLKNWLERNSFECTKFKGLKEMDIPDTELGLREIVTKLSIGSGQGFKRCLCKGDCLNNRCKCARDNLKCNSSCHGGKTCKNHD